MDYKNQLEYSKAVKGKKPKEAQKLLEEFEKKSQKENEVKNADNFGNVKKQSRYGR